MSFYIQLLKAVLGTICHLLFQAKYIPMGPQETWILDPSPTLSALSKHSCLSLFLFKPRESIFQPHPWVCSDHCRAGAALASLHSSSASNTAPWEALGLGQLLNAQMGQMGPEQAHQKTDELHGSKIQGTSRD